MSKEAPAPHSKTDREPISSLLKVIHLTTSPLRGCYLLLNTDLFHLLGRVEEKLRHLCHRVEGTSSCNNSIKLNFLCEFPAGYYESKKRRKRHAASTLTLHISGKLSRHEGRLMCQCSGHLQRFAFFLTFPVDLTASFSTFSPPPFYRSSFRSIKTSYDRFLFSFLSNPSQTPIGDFFFLSSGGVFPKSTPPCSELFSSPSSVACKH